MQPYYQDDFVTLYHADNRDVMPHVDVKAVDMLLTDPPYGVAWQTNYSQEFGKTMALPNGRQYPAGNWDAIAGDDKPFDPRPWLTFKYAILWGVNHFWRDLPTGRVLVWDKRLKSGKSVLSHGEVGFMKGGFGTWIYSQLWVGMWRSGEENPTRRLHPTQKPVGLMRWCMTFAGSTSKTPRQGIDLVLDPYAGSGTTGVAAKQLGKRAVLIEVEEAYCEAAARRLQNTVMQGELAL